MMDGQRAYRPTARRINPRGLNVLTPCIMGRGDGFFASSLINCLDSLPSLIPAYNLKLSEIHAQNGVFPLPIQSFCGIIIIEYCGCGGRCGRSSKPVSSSEA